MSAARPATRQWSARRQRGVAMVEFVVGAPILLLLLYSITEVGEILVQTSMLVDAARNADRYLASNALLGSSGAVNLSPALTRAAQNLAVYGNANGMGAPLLPDLVTGQVTVASDAGHNIIVSIAYPYQSLFGGAIPKFFTAGSINTGGLTLTAYASMLAL
jgi:Flp pilus assembly protein TadG